MLLLKGLIARGDALDLLAAVGRNFTLRLVKILLVEYLLRVLLFRLGRVRRHERTCQYLLLGIITYAARVVAAAIRRLLANQLGLAHAVWGGLPIERLAHFVTCNKKLER